MGKKLLYSINCRLYYKRIPFTFIFSVFFSLTAFAQTNISGIVNTYHKVVEIIPAKACVRVADISGLNVNSRVMLVQMKGASINIVNNSSYGDTTSLNEAGNYEIGAVCYIIGDSVFLFHNLLNTYNTSTGKVQLVQFAEYQSANVIDTIKAASWDSASGKGGVIAIFATLDIILNAPVFADSSGYKGGAYLLSSGTCSDFTPANGYVYNATTLTPQNGAYKGEGVATHTISQSGGRGAPANGGGGGNNHNNSGGGGANLNPGGIGGGNSSSGVSCTVSRRGEAGKAISSWNGQKTFMGGGGGAGQANSGFTVVNGGNGGGIIFIWAVNLFGNGNKISANGGNGGNSQSDGAGGGGGGGTIILHISNYSGVLSVNADGGSGGGSDNGLNFNRCYGGGGGGSGGVIYFTNSLPAITITTNGGAAGLEINREASCNPIPQTASAGSNGQLIANYNFPRSTDPAGYCQLLLPSKLIYFNAWLINRSVALSWKLDHPEFAKQFIVEKKIENGSWENFSTTNSNDNISVYSITDLSPKNGNNFYRLKVVEKNNTEYYSETRKIIAGVYKNDFMVYPNPAIDKIIVSVNNETGSLLQILDISGKTILEKKIWTHTTEIVLPRLSAGLYLAIYNGITRKLLIR